jgi:hypothetical protein
MVAPIIWGLAVGVGLLATACSGSGTTQKSDDVEPDADASPDIDADNDADADGDNDVDTDSDADSDTDIDTDSDIDIDIDADSDTDTDIDADSDTDSDIDSDVDTDTDIDADSDTDADTDSGTDTVTFPDPCERDGFNAYFFECSYLGDDCSAIDVDISGDELVFMTGYPTGRMGRIGIHASEPLNPLSQEFHDSVGDAYMGSGDIHPVQIEGMEDGRFLVPFENSVTAAGISVYDSAGTILQSDLLSTIYISSFLEIDPVDVRSGLLLGGRFHLAAAESITGAGLLLSYAQAADGTLDQGDVDFPVFTSGDYPPAIAALGGDEVALLNSGGADGVTMDIIDTSVVDPADAISSTILLGSAAADALSELKLTSDLSYAIVACDASVLKFVDMDAESVAGSIDLAGLGEIMDVTILGTMAYVSADSGDYLGDSGKVAIVDFSVPATPVLTRTIDVGHGLGAIAVHDSGTVYAAAKSCWDEELPADDASAPLKRIIAFDPALVTADDI